MVVRVESINANASVTGSVIQATLPPPPPPATTLPPKCSKSRCRVVPKPCIPRLHAARSRALVSQARLQDLKLQQELRRLQLVRPA